jgi:hypothetical protein
MRVDRGYLFWGIFFVLLGAIPLADREGWIQVGGLGDVWRLWPLILIGIGAAILFSRTSVGLVVTVIAAIVLGSLAGSALTSVGGGVFDCVPTGPPTGLARTSANGTLGPDAAVEVRMDCGTLAVSTSPGTSWTLDAGSAGGPPRIESSASDLTVRSADGAPGRQDWDLVLPTALGALRVDTNAASSDIHLGAEAMGSFGGTINAGDMEVATPAGGIATVRLEANAADLDLIAPGAITDLEVEANAASIELRLAGPVMGRVDGAAMSTRVCVPTTASLLIRASSDLAFAGDVQATGVVKDGDVWTRTGTGPRIELTVGGTASSFTLVDEEACE